MAEIQRHIDFLVKTNPIFNKAQFGVKKEVICVYDFAVDTGAIGTYVLCKLPDNTIITNVLLDVITAFTSIGGTGTIALMANTANDLLSAIDADTLSAIHAGIPVGTAATSVKLTADRDITLSIATAAMTAGKVAIHIEYFEGGQ